MTQKKLIAKLVRKKERLEEILNNQASISEDKLDTRMLKMNKYLTEIKYLLSILQLIKRNIYIVSESTLNTKMKKADFSSIEEEGQFFKLAFIQNFPYKDIYLLYLVSTSTI